MGLTESMTSALFFEDGENCDLALSNGDVFAFSVRSPQRPQWYILLYVICTTQARMGGITFISLVNTKALTHDWRCFIKRAKEAN